MVLDSIPQSLPVHFLGSRPQPPTSPHTAMPTMRVPVTSRCHELNHELTYIYTLTLCSIISHKGLIPPRDDWRRYASFRDSVRGYDSDPRLLCHCGHCVYIITYSHRDLVLSVAGRHGSLSHESQSRTESRTHVYTHLAQSSKGGMEWLRLVGSLEL